MMPIFLILLLIVASAFINVVIADVPRTLRSCQHLCNEGACLFEDCEDAKCPGGACWFERCIRPSCPGCNVTL